MFYSFFLLFNETTWHQPEQTHDVRLRKPCRDQHSGVRTIFLTWTGCSRNLQKGAYRKIRGCPRTRPRVQLDWSLCRCSATTRCVVTDRHYTNILPPCNSLRILSSCYFIIAQDSTIPLWSQTLPPRAIVASPLALRTDWQYTVPGY